jgi:3D (Asp-Asp-Asp) domain-containing protein
MMKKVIIVVVVAMSVAIITTNIERHKELVKPQTETVGKYRKAVPIVEEVIVPKIVEKEPIIVCEVAPKPSKKVRVDNRISMTVLSTAYAPTGNLTYTETVPMEGRTIAVDKNVIPLGTKVHIKGYGDYIAEDTGGLVKGKRIDIFMDSKRDCIEFGVKHLEISFER